jgi:hypothetical protein
MLKRTGYLLLLFPVGLVTPVGALGIALVLFALSLLVNRRLSYIDGLLMVLAGIAAFSWLTVDSYARSFIDTHSGAYFVFLMVLRFLYVCREDFLEFVATLPLYHYALLGAVYLLVQLHVGYTYEVGGLEVFAMIRLMIVRHQRNLLFAMLMVYLLLMFAISTRSTPLAVALLIGVIYLLDPPRILMRAAYLAVLIITPLMGYIMMTPGVPEALSGLDDNAAIRYEMLKGATSTMGLDELLFGSGFGTPFRDPNFDYLFSHPLLNEQYWVHQVSSHNSLFDIFFRFGLPVYIAFCLKFMGCLNLLQVSNKHYYMLMFVALYSLYVNAYLDSTRLSHIFSIFVAGGMFTLAPRAVAATRSVLPEIPSHPSMKGLR